MTALGRTLLAVLRRALTVGAATVLSTFAGDLKEIEPGSSAEVLIFGAIFLLIEFGQKYLRERGQ